MMTLIPIGEDFAGDTEPTELVPIYGVREIVNGIATREDHFPHEWQAHDLADVWRRQRHCLPTRIEIARVLGAEVTPIAVYGAEDEIAT